MSVGTELSHCLLGAQHSSSRNSSQQPTELAHCLLGHNIQHSGSRNSSKDKSKSFIGAIITPPLREPVSRVWAAASREEKLAVAQQPEGCRSFAAVITCLLYTSDAADE